LGVCSIVQTTEKAYTVSAITRIIKGTLEEQLTNIWIEGEISNYHHHSSGHRYITLKDDSAVIKVVLWRTAGQYLKFEPENGQHVLACGDITVYARGGNYQLNCRKLQPVGIGPLELAFRQLHEKLSAEGLFDDERKKTIPLYPAKIGVVTSPTSAAVRDIIKVTKRRNSSVELIVFPATVQGEGAENTIADGLSYFNSRSDIDLIIVARGGGSIEDLWPFNTELVVRSIADSGIPVVSGVGHEIDTTLADLVADLRTATPSAAAEIAVWSLGEFRSEIRRELTSQTISIRNLIVSARERVWSILNRPVFRRPADLLDQQRQRLDNATKELMSGGKNCFETHKNRLSLALTKLEALSPLKVLARGYSVTQREEDEKVVTSINGVCSGDTLVTRVIDGLLFSKVERTQKQDSN